MQNDEHRFETARFDFPKHQLPEEQRRSEAIRFREHRVPHWVYRIILILVLSAAAVLLWYNRSNLAPENTLAWVQSHIVGLGVGDGYPKTITGASVKAKNFVSADKNVIFSSDTAFVICNSTAKELVNRQHSFSNPVLKVNGTRALLYNLDGKSCQLETTGQSSLKLTTAQNILAGAISENGRVALVTRADGYCGLLTVYNETLNVKSYYWFYEYYPSAVALSPDGTKAAVAGISAKDGEIVSAVYLLDTNSGKTAQPFAVYTGNMIHSVYWDTDSTVVAVGDTAASVIHVSSNTKTDYSFNGSQLTAYCSDGGRTALALSSYGGSADCRFVVLDKNGSEIFTRQINSAVKSVSLYGQTAAALSGDSAYFYSLAGPSGSANSRNAGSDAAAIALRDESSAYILGISEIRLINNR